MKEFKRTVIACSSIKAELEQAATGAKGINLKFFPMKFHRKPRELTPLLQKAIDKAAENSESVVVGFGLCSNATVGLKAPGTGLIIPTIHDCISMYLGGEGNYKTLFHKYPGTYFLTKNWIDTQKDPLGLVENEYRERVGYEMARETMEMEIRNYNYIAFINNETPNTEYYRAKARENAEFFNKEFIEIQGSDALIKKILYGPYHRGEFIILEPGETSKQKYFIK